MRTNIKVLCLLAALTLLLVSCSPAANSGFKIVAEIIGTDPDAMTTAHLLEAMSGLPIEHYSQAAESESVRLYVNPDTLAVILEDKASGQRLESSRDDPEGRANKSWKGFMSSGFAVEFFNDRSPMPERLDAVNGNPTIEYKPVKGGFDAQVSYEKQGITFTLHVRLTDDGISVIVPAQSITESETVRICAFYLYPFMGSAKLGDRDGYMLIPEGAGALIALQNNDEKFKSPYVKRVYGNNLGTRREYGEIGGHWQLKEDIDIIAPYFGMAHTDTETAFFATITKGGFNAEILAYPNGVVTDYDWIAARFITREQYTMQTTRSRGILTSEKTPYFRDIQLDFHMLTGENANYMGMAALYRDKLTNMGFYGDKNTEYKTRLDFFGADAEAWMLSYSSSATTTTKQMEAILENLHGEGLTQLLAIYKGWQTGGITRNYGSGNVSIESKLGNKRDLLEVAKLVTNNGGDFLLHQDLLLASPGRTYNTSRDIAKGINQIVMTNPTNENPFELLYYLTPIRSFEIASALCKSFDGNDNIGFAIGSVTNTLFSYYSQGNVHSRGETAMTHASMFEELDLGVIAMESPFDYYWPSMDVFLDMPLYGSNYSFISSEIPFLPIVLKGTVPYYAEYVNFEPNEQEFILKMIEYGAYPSFLLTHKSPKVLRNTNSSSIYCSEYETFKERILSYSQELSRLYELSDDTVITNHESIYPDTICVTYGNGLKIYINYSKNPYASGEVFVPAMSYQTVLPGSEK